MSFNINAKLGLWRPLFHLTQSSRRLGFDPELSPMILLLTRAVALIQKTDFGPKVKWQRRLRRSDFASTVKLFFSIDNLRNKVWQAKYIRLLFISLKLFNSFTRYFVQLQRFVSTICVHYDNRLGLHVSRYHVGLCGCYFKFFETSKKKDNALSCLTV